MIEAEDIKDQYLYQKRKEFPNLKFGQKDWQKDFKLAADICNELGATAEDFVQAQFDAAFDPHYYPSYLHSVHCRENYRRLQARRNMVIVGSFDRWRYYLRCNITAGKTVEQALLDDTLDFPAWFRILVTVEPNEEIIKKYKFKAQREMTEPLKKYLMDQKCPLERIINV
jgi:hypothetical protein